MFMRQTILHGYQSHGTISYPHQPKPINGFYGYIIPKSTVAIPTKNPIPSPAVNFSSLAITLEIDIIAIKPTIIIAFIVTK